jgi:hypothetical protein
MSQATVYSTAQYGTVDDDGPTGMFVSSVSFTSSSDMAEATDTLGCLVGVAIHNPRTEVSADGIIKVATTAPTGQIGEVITLANATEGGGDRLGDLIDAGGSSVLIVTGGSTNPTNTGFETGNITGIYYPYLDDTTPEVLTA